MLRFINVRSAAHRASVCCAGCVLASVVGKEEPELGGKMTACAGLRSSRLGDGREVPPRVSVSVNPTG